MKKLNRKGFTLIESIITFAILAIAGMMFIALFSNVSTLMKEGSFIKTESDDMYNQLVSQSTTDESDPLNKTGEIYINFKIGGVDKSQKVFIQSQTCNVDDFDMKLTRFVTGSQQVGWLPSEGENTPDTPGVGEETTYSRAAFCVLKDKNSMPKDYTTFVNGSWNNYTDPTKLIIDNSIVDTITNQGVSIFNENSIDQYLNNDVLPTNTQLDILKNDVYYNNELSNGFKVMWIGILYNRGLNINNQYIDNFPIVYGILIPSQTKKVINIAGKVYFYDTIDSNINGKLPGGTYKITINEEVFIKRKNEVYDFLKSLSYEFVYIRIEETWQ